MKTFTMDDIREMNKEAREENIQIINSLYSPEADHANMKSYE